MINFVYGFIAGAVAGSVVTYIVSKIVYKKKIHEIEDTYTNMVNSLFETIQNNDNKPNDISDDYRKMSHMKAEYDSFVDLYSGEDDDDDYPDDEFCEFDTEDAKMLRQEEDWCKEYHCPNCPYYIPEGEGDPCTYCFDEDGDEVEILNDGTEIMVIDSSEFGVLDSFGISQWLYNSEDETMYDLNGREIVDYTSIVGTTFKNVFAETNESTVYVKNDTTRRYYEITEDLNG